MINRPGKLKKPYDIYNQNFEDYIGSLVDEMTEAQREALPHELTRKAFTPGGAFRPDRLSFGELAYLATAFNKKITIIVDGDDDESATTIDTLRDAQLVQKRKKPLHEVAEKMVTDAMFVLGDRELMEATTALRLINHMQLWRHLLEQIKKFKKGKITGYKGQRAILRTVIQLLAKYDAIKGVLAGEFGLTYAEWYALLFFFDGEKSPGDFHKMFSKVPMAMQNARKGAIQRLTRSGYFQPRGQKASRVYSLTAKGDELLSKVIQRVFIQHAKAVKVI